MSPQEKEFKKWFDGLGIRHFSAKEFISYSRRTRRGVKNSLPPKSKWKNILPSLWAADVLREHLGKSCTLLSSYRSPAYNEAVGGAKFSQHKEHKALDLSFNGVSPQRAYNTIKKLRDAGLFRGGIGLYVRSGFIHIDCRGANRSWKGN